MDLARVADLWAAADSSMTVGWAIGSKSSAKRSLSSLDCANSSMIDDYLSGIGSWFDDTYKIDEYEGVADLADSLGILDAVGKVLVVQLMIYSCDDEKVCLLEAS